MVRLGSNLKFPDCFASINLFMCIKQNPSMERHMKGKVLAISVLVILHTDGKFGTNGEVKGWGEVTPERFRSPVTPLKYSTYSRVKNTSLPHLEPHPTKWFQPHPHDP